MSLRGSKATEAISRNFRIYFRNFKLGILEFILGILEFSMSLRGSKATEAISMNSRFYFGNSSLRNSRLGILEFPKIRYCKALKKEGAILFIKP